MSVMNLRALHDDVAKILDADVPFNISVEVWDHRHQNGKVQIEVAIWDNRKHYTGPTPEAALHMVKLAHGLDTDSAIPTAIILPDTVPDRSLGRGPQH